MAMESKGLDTRLAVPAPSKFFLNLVRGAAVAGSLTAVAPIERVKLILQVQDASATITADKRYKGIVDALTRVPKEQGGVAALWRGNFANIVRYLPTQALNFGFNDHYKKFFVYYGPNIKEHLLLVFGGHCCAGGAAGATALCLTYPLDFARTRLAADVGRAGSREFKGLTDCLIKIVKSDGPIGLYRGFVVSLQGVIIYRAAYFGLFDMVKMMKGLDKKRNTGLATLGLAYLTTVVSGTLAYPWDTVRRSMMMQSGRKEIPYKSGPACALKIIKHNDLGWLGLYKGALANVFSRVTGGAFALAIYDHIQKSI